MKLKKIITGKVIKIFENKIYVKVDKKIFECEKKQISDYPINIFQMFKVGNFYKFLLIDNETISYKEIRPKLIKNKKYIIPTISGSKNLEKFLLKKIKNMSLKQSIN